MEVTAKEWASGADEKAAEGLLSRRPDAEEDAHGLSIKILGQGCSRCDGLEREIVDIMAELELEAEIEHVRDIKEIAKNGVMGVPALIINGQVKSVGNVPPRAKIIEWLKEVGKKQVMRSME